MWGGVPVPVDTWSAWAIRVLAVKARAHARMHACTHTLKRAHGRLTREVKPLQREALSNSTNKLNLLMPPIPPVITTEEPPGLLVAARTH